jgi:hypothetical protein
VVIVGMEASLMEREAEEMGLERRAMGDGILMQAAKEVSRSEVGTLEEMTSVSNYALTRLLVWSFQTGARGRTLCRRREPHRLDGD